MGADLFIAHLVIDKGKDPDWDAGVKAARAWEGDFQEDGWFCEFDTLQRVREELEKDVQILRDAWTRHRRDATWLEVSGKLVFLTGGFSWGDPPTDLYDPMMRLIVSGVHAALGFES